MRRCRALLGWSLWGGLSLVLSAPALADSLHAQSQVQSSGHLAVEERGYEVFIEPRPKGQSSLRLRITYFNSSSQPMDMVSRLAVPANSEIVGVAVQGDHGWIAGGPSQPRVQKDEIQGVYATLVPSHERNGSSAIAELVGRQLPAQAYTAIELQLNVPVQRLLDHERLCLAPRMIQGPGLQSHRRVSLRDSHGKAMAFFVDGTPQSEPSTRLPANRGGCISWFAPQRYRNPLHFDFYAYAPSDQGHRFALDLALGPQAQRPTQGLSVMLDASSSVETQTFARGVQLYATIQKLGIQGTGLWSFDRHLAKISSTTGTAKHPSRPGSDLVAALTQWLTQRKEKRKRETLVVVTDGLLPLPEDPAQLRALTKALRRARGLTLLLLVDDPLLARQGIGRGHPLLELAAQLGARLSLRSLADYGDQAQKLDRKAVDALLRSPQVARAPQVRLPRGCTLATAVPAHLVAGQSQRIDGICEPRIKRPWAEVKLRLGTKIHKKRARASRIKPMTTHWASATSADQAQKARAAGFARPIWFSRAMLRESELTFAAAGKIQERQGYLDAELLQQRLREHLWPRAHACYNRALGRSRRQEGVAELAIALGKGEISLVQARSKSLAVKDPRFLQCLEQAAWKVRVPSALADPVVYRVYYPLKFSRPKNAEVGQISQEDRLRYEWLLGRTTGTH